jgi:hypothetical protein
MYFAKQLNLCEAYIWYIVLILQLEFIGENGVWVVLGATFN